jgi:hypothetical protein
MTKIKGKTTAEKRKKPSASATTISPTPSIVKMELQGSDFNPRNLESVQGSESNDFKYKSESEPRLEDQMASVQENAAYVGEHWQERIKKEGKVYYTCPICTGASKIKAFGKDGKKTIADHIKKEHPMRVKELKMKKAQKSTYTPEEKIESPKRTLADAIHPKYRDQIEAQLAMQKQLQPISEQARNLSVHGNALLKLVTMTESQAVGQLRSLNDKDLIAIVQLASNRGKRLLSRAARKLADQKGLNTGLQGKDPSEKHIIMQEALRKLGSKVVVSHR